MAIDSGHGGTVTLHTANDTVETQVRRWSIEHTAQLHEITVMGQTSRVRLKGLEDWNATFEFFGASDTNLSTLKAGTALTNFELTATSGGSNNVFSAGSGQAFVESVSLSRDVDNAVQGTMRVAGSGVLTLPVSV